MGLHTEHIDAAEQFRLKHPHMNRMKAWPLFRTEHADLLARRHLNRAGFFAALTSAEERQGPPQIAQPAAAASTKQRRKRNSGSTSHNDSTKGAAGRKRDKDRDSSHAIRAKKTKTTIETWLPLGRVTAGRRNTASRGPVDDGPRDWRVLARVGAVRAVHRQVAGLPWECYVV